MDDYISRADFRQTLINTPFHPRCQTTPDLLTSVQDRLNDTLELLDNFPAADVRPVVRGEWMMRVDSIFNGECFVEWFCSKCGYVRNRGWQHTNDGRKPNAKICENCGADMRGETNGE